MGLDYFADIMYHVIDAENLSASILFVVSAIILAYGVATMFIAAIISDYNRIRDTLELYIDEKKKRQPGIWQRIKDPFSSIQESFKQNIEIFTGSKVRYFFHYLREIPLLVIGADLLIQCTVTVATSANRIHHFYLWQVAASSFLLTEIIFRFILFLPQKAKQFFTNILNLTDLFLAIANMIILLPVIHNNITVYRWLSVFQIARFYRIVLAIPMTRVVWFQIISKGQLIVEITVFYYALHLIASIFACLLLQGVVPSPDNGGYNIFNFESLSNAFLAMYVISSSRGWTSIFYDVVHFTGSRFNQTIIAIFIIGWLILSNFIILNIFIALFSDDFELSETGKKIKQIVLFMEQENLFESSLNKEELKRLLVNFSHHITQGPKPKGGDFPIFKEAIRVMKTINDQHNLDAQQVIITAERYIYTDEEYFRNQKSLIIGTFQLTKNVKNTIKNAPIKKHTKWENLLEKIFRSNRSLGIFSINNRIRKLCQKVVWSSYGIRKEGQTKPTAMWSIFWIIMMASTIGIIVLAAYITPIYYKNNLEGTSWNWYTKTEMAFLSAFTLEIIIKVIADGLAFTPNAYVYSYLNVIDFIVWLTLLLNLVQELVSKGHRPVFFRFLCAFRPLRLLSLIPNVHHIFYNIFVLGFRKICMAFIIAFSLLLPFSIWALQIFRGRMLECNNTNLSGSLENCVGEYSNLMFKWEVLSPAVVKNPFFNFDSFRHSVLIMFEVISLEGWVEVLVASMSITGVFSQPEFSPSYEGLFMIIYNTVATVLILTIFLAVILENYARSTGAAYFTQGQYTWFNYWTVELSWPPSPLPYKKNKNSTLRANLSTQFKRTYSWVHKVAVLSVVGFAIVLLSEFYPTDFKIDYVRWPLLFTFILAYLFIVLLKLWTFGPHNFIRNPWDMYSLGVSLGTMGVQIASFFVDTNTSYYISIRAIFDSCVLTLILHHSRRLSNILKSLAATFSSLFQLLIIWFILFLVFAIGFNQAFGLIKIQGNESPFLNFRTVPNTLVFLFRTSCGGNWNQILGDYLVKYPTCSGTDCPKNSYLYGLFISWNILSMYIFANLVMSYFFQQFPYIVNMSSEFFSDIRKRKLVAKLRYYWAEYDLDEKGCMKVEDVKHLLGRIDRESVYYRVKKIADSNDRIAFHTLLLFGPFHIDEDVLKYFNLRDLLHVINYVKTSNEQYLSEEEENLRIKKTVQYMLYRRVLLHRQMRYNSLYEVVLHERITEYLTPTQAAEYLQEMDLTKSSQILDNYYLRFVNNIQWTLNDIRQRSLFINIKLIPYDQLRLKLLDSITLDSEVVEEGNSVKGETKETEKIWLQLYENLNLLVDRNGYLDIFKLLILAPFYLDSNTNNDNSSHHKITTHDNNNGLCLTKSFYHFALTLERSYKTSA